MAAFGWGTRISSWCFVAFLLAPPCSSSDAAAASPTAPIATGTIAVLEAEAAASSEVYLVVDLAARRLAVRARGVELHRWDLDEASLLTRHSQPVVLPFAATMSDWPAPRTRSFHVIPGAMAGGQPSTAPSELPTSWRSEVVASDGTGWLLSVNEHRSLLSGPGRLWEALSNRSPSGTPTQILALTLSDANAQALYHLARPKAKVIVATSAPALATVALPTVASTTPAAESATQSLPLSTALWLVVAGLVGLVVGGELLVRGAVRLASAAGLSTLVIGLTVVAYGTSAPELAVTLRSSLAGAGDLGLGNVVGSNIFNILVILGLSALVQALVVHPLLIRRDVTVMIGLSLLLGGLALDGQISRLDGVLLLVLGLGYTAWVVRMPSPATTPVELVDEIEPEVPRGPKGRLLAIGSGLCAGGIGALVLGAGWLVEGASSIARGMGISELVVGLTIVAAGTSLPEVATSIVAVFKGERDIAVGNVIGSNIFNIAWVLGLAASISGGFAVAADALRTDLPVMIGIAILIWLLLRAGHRLVRLEGLLLLGIYGLYLAELWSRSV